MAGGTDDSGPGPDDPIDSDRHVEPDPGVGPADREEAAWRAIVENYGERPEVEDTSGEAGPDPAGPDQSAPGDPARLRRLFEPLDRWSAASEASAGAPATGAGGPDPDSDLARGPDAPFVPPVPPLAPRPPADRRAAWLGVIGGPALLLVALLLSIDLPSVLALGCVVAFVAGFVYLVVRMPREPRDPGDDGARV